MGRVTSEADVHVRLIRDDEETLQRVTTYGKSVECAEEIARFFQCAFSNSTPRAECAPLYDALCLCNAKEVGAHKKHSCRPLIIQCCTSHGLC